MKNYTRDIISTIMSIIITGTTLPAVLMFCIPYFVYSFSHYLKRISLLALNSTLSGRLADRIDIEIWGGIFSKFVVLQNKRDCSTGLKDTIMKKNKSVAVVLILMIIICHLLVTFFKVNTDYFKYNYKFDKQMCIRDRYSIP